MTLTNGWTGGQYSAFRVGLAGCVALQFALGWTVASRASPPAGGTAGTTVLALFVAAGCLLLALGWHDRWAAIGLAAALLMPQAWNPASLSPGVFLLAGVLILHTVLPPAPYGSLAAAGRIDPGGGWHMSGDIFLAAWAGLVLVQLAIGETGLALLLWNSPRGGWILDAGRLLLLPFVFLSSTRPWAWLGWLLLTLPMLAAPGSLELAIALLAMQCLTFDPAWIHGLPGETETVFYDGHCGLCHRAVRFLLAEDRSGTAFRFATLDSEALQAVTTEAERAALPDSSVVRTTDGRLLVRAAGLAYMLRRLGGLWRLIGEFARCLPLVLLDCGYDGIARIRKRLFPTPAEACPLLPPALRQRFLA